MRTTLLKIAATAIALLGLLNLYGGAPTWQRVNYTSSTTFAGFMSLSYTNVSEGDYVGAFVGNECRMIVQLFNHNDTLYVSGILHGGDIDESNVPETATFKLWRAATNQEVNLSGTVQTKPDEVPGIYLYEIAAPEISITSLSVAGTTVNLQDGVTLYNVGVNQIAAPSLSDYVVQTSNPSTTVSISPATTLPGTTTITLRTPGQDDVIYTLSMTSLVVCDLNVVAVSAQDLSISIGTAASEIPTFQVEPSSGTITWYDSNNNSVGTGTTFKPNVSTASQSIYTYSVSIVDGECVSDELQFTLAITNCNVASPSVLGTLSFCTGNQTTLMATGESGASFSWKNATGQEVSNSSAVTISVAGNYTVTQTNTCESSPTSVNIVENAMPIVTISAPSSLLTTSAATTIIISPADGILASSGAGLTGTSFNPAVAGVGTHTLTLTKTSLQGCTASTTAQILVSEPGGPDISDLTDLIRIAQDSINAAIIGTNPGNYTQESVDALNAAIAVANNVALTAQTDQEVLNAITDLQTAINAFVRIPDTDLDFSELNEAITDAGDLKDSLDPNTYPTGITALEEAISDAQDALENASTQEEINNAVSALLAIINQVRSEIPNSILPIFENIVIRPTITSGIVYIDGTENMVSISVLTATGSVVLESKVIDSSVVVDLSNYSDAVYTVVLVALDGSTLSTPIVKK